MCRREHVDGCRTVASRVTLLVDGHDDAVKRQVILPVLAMFRQQCGVRGGLPSLDQQRLIGCNASGIKQDEGEECVLHACPYYRTGCDLAATQRT